MFLRRCERRRSGKGHTYWALVESVRTARGSRHRVVAYLGALTAGQEGGWATLGRRLDGKDRPPPTLFDPPRWDEPADDEPVVVNLKRVRLERVRAFGDVWLALGLWRLLGLDGLLARVMPAGREEVPWPVAAAIPVIGREQVTRGRATGRPARTMARSRMRIRAAPHQSRPTSDLTDEGARVVLG